MPTRPCWIEIRTRSLEENYQFLASLAAGQAELLAIVKANAYGHSLAACAPAVVRAGASWLGVNSVEEAVATRALCPEARILVIGGVFAGQGLVPPLVRRGRRPPHRQAAGWRGGRRRPPHPGRTRGPARSAGPWAAASATPPRGSGRPPGATAAAAA